MATNQSHAVASTSYLDCHQGYQSPVQVLVPCHDRSQRVGGRERNSWMPFGLRRPCSPMPVWIVRGIWLNGVVSLWNNFYKTGSAVFTTVCPSASFRRQQRTTRETERDKGYYVRMLFNINNLLFLFVFSFYQCKLPVDPWRGLASPRRSSGRQEEQWCLLVVVTDQCISLSQALNQLGLFARHLESAFS